MRTQIMLVKKVILLTAGSQMEKNYGSKSFAPSWL